MQTRVCKSATPICAVANFVSFLHCCCARLEFVSLGKFLTLARRQFAARLSAAEKAFEFVAYCQLVNWRALRATARVDAEADCNRTFAPIAASTVRQSP